MDPSWVWYVDFTARYLLVSLTAAPRNLSGDRCGWAVSPRSCPLGLQRGGWTGHWRKIGGPPSLRLIWVLGPPCLDSCILKKHQHNSWVLFRFPERLYLAYFTVFDWVCLNMEIPNFMGLSSFLEFWFRLHDSLGLPDARVSTKLTWEGAHHKRVRLEGCLK